ncbi:MAG: hypothetical protein HYT87_12875 [Nitrospirae bacterium]|nr:hypothetical protein [Nitrospirota bacterium]
MKHIVSFSGGVGSWAAAKRVAVQYGTKDLTLLFADVLMEDEDLYRFIAEAAGNVGGTLIRLTEGRDPWTVFFDQRFLGNSRVDPCSKILKRRMLDRWRDAHVNPAEDICYIGIDWSEAHRLDRLRKRCAPFRYEAPLCEAPYLTKTQMLDLLKIEGIKPPRLYEMGFPHNNCGGFCVKAGQAQFRRLLTVLPERYAFHEKREQEIRAFLQKNVSILRDRRGGKSEPLTLKDFRERVERDAEVGDAFESGGFGCVG